MQWRLVCVLILFINVVTAQEETVERWREDQASLDENRESEEDLNQLQHFKQKPLDLNLADQEDLAVFPFLTALHIEQFLNYRKALGPFHHVMELQAIPGWDPELIRKILPFVTSRSISNHQWDDEFAKSNQQLLFRSALNRNAGFLMRYHFQSPHIRMGINLEKDKGEQIFQRGKGIAFLSAHASWYGTGLLRQVVIGDYLVNIGQGLLLWQGRGMRKNGMTVMIKRQLPVLQEYRSNDENRFMRGVGVLFRKNNLALNLFVSNNKLDANTGLDSLTGKRTVLSFQNTGLHRTAGELLDKNALGLMSFGGGISYNRRALSVSLNEVRHIFSLPLQKEKEPYNLFAASGTRLHGRSISYHYTWRNAHVFGEMVLTAKGKAVLQGLMVAADQKLDFALLYRKADRDYRVYGANAFLESTDVNNEEGIYIGGNFRPSTHVTLDFYIDQFRWPWLRYRNNSPSMGWDHFVQMIWRPDKKKMILIRWKQESKPENEPGVAIIRKSFSTIRENLRLHLEYKISSTLEWRSRVELIIVNQAAIIKQNGLLVFSEMLWKSFKNPVSGGVRWTIYDTQSYDTRIYAYENDVMYYNLVPAFYGRGMQVYFNIRYKLTDKLNFFLKCSNRLQGGQAGWFSRFQVIFFW